jgi:hypothetical protein
MKINYFPTIYLHDKRQSSPKGSDAKPLGLKSIRLSIGWTTDSQVTETGRID